jgi:hypothetical protein
LSHGNALIFQCKFFLRTTKNRLTDPSEIRALEFKGKFRRFGNLSVSTTIATDWTIFRFPGTRAFEVASEKHRQQCSACVLVE